MATDGRLTVIVFGVDDEEKGGLQVVLACGEVLLTRAKARLSVLELCPDTASEAFEKGVRRANPIGS